MSTQEDKKMPKSVPSKVTPAPVTTKSVISVPSATQKDHPRSSKSVSETQLNGTKRGRRSRKSIYSESSYDSDMEDYDMYDDDDDEEKPYTSEESVESVVIKKRGRGRPRKTPTKVSRASKKKNSYEDDPLEDIETTVKKHSSVNSEDGKQSLKRARGRSNKGDRNEKYKIPEIVSSVDMSEHLLSDEDVDEDEDEDDGPCDCASCRRGKKKRRRRASRSRSRSRRCRR